MAMSRGHFDQYKKPSQDGIRVGIVKYFLLHTLASNPGTEGGEKSAWFPLFAHAHFPTFRESRIISRHSRGLLTSDTCTYRITIILSQWRFYGRPRPGCFACGLPLVIYFYDKSSISNSLKTTIVIVHP